MASGRQVLRHVGLIVGVGGLVVGLVAFRQCAPGGGPLLARSSRTLRPRTISIGFRMKTEGHSQPSDVQVSVELDSAGVG